MTGLDTILESIRSEGRRTADGILEKARKDADEILSRGETDASLRREDILRGVETVFYTHLDVYKRQRLYCPSWQAGR